MGDKKSLYLCLSSLCLFLMFFSACSEAKVYPYRWIYVHGKSLENTDQVELIRSLAETAREHGLNGIVLDAYFDRLDLEPPYNYKNLRTILDICRENGVEFIPACFHVGYNAPMLAQLLA